VGDRVTDFSATFDQSVLDRANFVEEVERSLLVDEAKSSCQRRAGLQYFQSSVAERRADARSAAQCTSTGVSNRLAPCPTRTGAWCSSSGRSSSGPHRRGLALLHLLVGDVELLSQPVQLLLTRARTKPHLA